MPSQTVTIQLYFGGKALPLQEHLKFLGVTVDRGLCFDHHVSIIARLRVSVLRTMAGTFDPRNTVKIYKEYGCLSMMSSVATHMQKLNAVQRRALLLAGHEEHQEDQWSTIPLTGAPRCGSVSGTKPRCSGSLTADARGFHHELPRGTH